tara:strand:+ start:5556 stop:5804 length:249 start_codon:yes stop_codon:yes gene_type:complete
MGLLRTISIILTTLKDAIPPYRKIEGVLDGKESSKDDNYFLLVGNEIIQVDELTFSELMVGEALRIRSTRSMKAISIDRLTP